MLRCRKAPRYIRVAGAFARPGPVPTVCEYLDAVIKVIAAAATASAAAERRPRALHGLSGGGWGEEPRARRGAANKHSEEASD